MYLFSYGSRLFGPLFIETQCRIMATCIFRIKLKENRQASWCTTCTMHWLGFEMSQALV